MNPLDGAGLFWEPLYFRKKLQNQLYNMPYMLGDQITFWKSIQFSELIGVKNCSSKKISQIIFKWFRMNIRIFFICHLAPIFARSLERVRETLHHIMEQNSPLGVSEGQPGWFWHSESGSGIKCHSGFVRIWSEFDECSVSTRSWICSIWRTSKDSIHHLWVIKCDS